MTIQTVTIYGCGTIGSGWAAFFAAKGLGVRLWDSSAAARIEGRNRALNAIDFLVSQKLCDPSAAESARARIVVCDEPRAALEGAQFIQESIAERLEIKRSAHELIEEHAPREAIIASSTSGLLASDMQKDLKHPERFLIAHPFNPPHLVPLVELVSGPKTSAETLSETHAFYTRLGKIPVVLNKEVPGHLANRLAAAVWREAIHLVASGVASLEDVDKALYAGPGLRWAFMGQHMVYHLGGGAGGYAAFFKHLGPAAETWMKDLASWDQIPDEARTEVLKQIEPAVRGRSMQELERWRDERLATLVRTLYPPQAP